MASLQTGSLYRCIGGSLDPRLQQNYAVRESIRFSRANTLVVESQLDSADALLIFDAYTIGKLPDHEGR